MFEQIVTFGRNLINPRWIFNPYSSFNYKMDLIWAGIFCLIILLGICLWFLLNSMSKKQAAYLNLRVRYFTYCLTIGIIGLVLVFFHFEGIAYLAMPFWLIILTIIAMVWLGWLLSYTFIQIPQQIIQCRQKQEFEKYLPHKRKKNDVSR